jgi:hypothetical protein
MYKSVEKYNITNLKKLVSQNKYTLEEIINNGGRCKTGDDYYPEYVLSILKQMLLCPNGSRITYKFAKDCDCGRQYAKPFGLQCLPNNIRDYITQDTGLIDYDMKNCHFSILNNLCIKHSLNAPILAELVSDRDAFLKKHNIDKIKLLTIVNSDKPFVYNSLVEFVKEMDDIKSSINDIYKSLVNKGNKKNPISSKTNKILCYFENEALMKVIHHYNIKNASLMFDGFMTTVSLNLQDLKDLTGYEWTIKPHNNTDIIEEYYIPTQYDIYKKEVELNTFITIDPFNFYHRVSPNHDYSIKSKSDMLAILAPYKPDDSNKDFLELWLLDKDRRQYDRTIFNPDPNFIQSEHPKEFNLYKNFDVLSWNDMEEENIDFFIELVSLNSGTDPEAFQYFMNWIAHIFQFPHIRPDVCVVLKGAQGTGKDSLTKIINKLMGSSNNYLYKTPDFIDIAGQFNDVIDKKLFIQVNELSGSDGCKYQNKFKDMITAEKNNIKKKYMNIYEQDNFIRYMCCSNGFTPVVVENGDRRFAVFNCSFNRKGDADWWKFVHKQINKKSVIYSIYKYLMKLDLSNFDPTDIVETKAKRVMKSFSGHPLHKFLKYDFNKVLPEKEIRKVRYAYIPCSEFYDLYQDSEYYEQYKQSSGDIKKVMLNILGIDEKKILIIEGRPKKNCYVFQMNLVNKYLNTFLQADEEDVEWDKTPDIPTTIDGYKPMEELDSQSSE